MPWLASFVINHDMTDQRPLLRAIFDAAVAAAHPDVVLASHLRAVPKGRVIVLAADTLKLAASATANDVLLILLSGGGRRAEL